MITEEIKAVIDAKCSALGFELFDLKLVQAGSRGVLRITIDSPSGVTISDCEHVSNELSVVLDVENFLGGRPYTLEVSSPGIDRPLKTERDFRRTVGRVVVLQMSPDFDGKKTLRMRVTGCGNSTLEGEIDGKTVAISITHIASGKEELQFK